MSDRVSSMGLKTPRAKIFFSTLYVNKNDNPEYAQVIQLLLIIFLNGTQSLLINDGLIFQNAVNIHFSGKSIQERGTLCQLKAFLNHRNVSTDVMNCFNDVENFIRFLTEAHIVYLAMYLLNMRDIDGKPSQARGNVSQKAKVSCSDYAGRLSRSYGAFHLLKMSTQY